MKIMKKTILDLINKLFNKAIKDAPSRREIDISRTFIHISDTHMQHEKITISEHVDFLFHTGDFCKIYNFDGSREADEEHFLQALEFLNWFANQSANNKVLISGNHETFLNHEDLRDQFEEECRRLGLIFLDDATEVHLIDGVRICGAGLYPTVAQIMPQKHAYYQREDYLYNNISTEQIDILLTHSCPMINDNWDFTCEELRIFIEERENLSYLLCGHIHELKGEYEIGNTKVINAATDFNTKIYKIKL